MIPDRVQLDRKDATVLVSDVYAGPGLKGVPRGTVKQLRVFAYHFAYRGTGGHAAVGTDGSWDVKRILGTVPVREDGSAFFSIPANTPISIQPLDAEGKAVQLMRSWFTAMPGEHVSCLGCHERRAETLPVRQVAALRAPPSRISPWRGPVRGFSFGAKSNPSLDKYCVECHDDRPRPDGGVIPDLRGGRIVGPDCRDPALGVLHPADCGCGIWHRWPINRSVSYEILQRYVRRPGAESDYHLLPPMEYHADTSELIQMLQKGHHGVQLDSEAWDRLVTWCDLNVPYHGNWGEYHIGHPARRSVGGSMPSCSQILMKTLNCSHRCLPQDETSYQHPTLRFRADPRNIPSRGQLGWEIGHNKARRGTSRFPVGRSRATKRRNVNRMP